jgi:hypothetical protein
MSRDRIRIRRLSRFAACAEADVAQAEIGLATAARAAGEAAARRAAIAQILAETRPVIGSGGAHALMAGAHLRQLLRPAAAAAADAEDRLGQDRTAAERRLRTASARADGLSERLLEARRRAATAAEQKIADLTPARKTSITPSTIPTKGNRP